MARRMAKEWTNTLLGTNAFVGNAGAILGSVAFSIPGTVIRMIGEYVIAATAAPAAVDGAVITMGIGFVSTDAFTVGASAMPDPGGDPEFPWLFWKSHALFFGGTDP